MAADVAVDVLQVYTKGIAYYQSLLKEISIHQNDIRVIQQCLPLLQSRDCRLFINIINEKEKHIKNIMQKSYQHFFNMDTLPLVHQYKAIINTPVTHSFMDNTTDSLAQLNDIAKNKICRQFMKIIDGFQLPHIVFSNTINNEITTPFHHSGPISPGTTTTSATTHAIRPSTVVISNKLKYDRVSHFKLSINKFQGKTSNIPEDVLKKLDDKIQTHRIQKVSKNHLRLFLKELKLPKYYEDINYMFCYYNDCFQMYDISHIEHDLITDFNKIADVYDSLEFFPGNERKNFISTQYVLYHLLQKHKFECRLSDFNVLKTIARLRVHDEIMKLIFDILGWKFQCTY